MNIKLQLTSNVSKVALITALFIVINWYMTFYNDSLLHSAFSLGLTGIYNFKVSMLMSTITGIFAGVIGGSVLVYVNDRYFRRQSYGYALKATFLAYTIVFVFITLSMSLIHARFNMGPVAKFVELFEHAATYMFSKMALVFYLFWGMLSLLIVISLQISDKFGPGVLSKFLAGRYHQPREEQRFFMFIDLKSSTTIAEKIGSTKYLNLLNDLFVSITDPILTCEGEIYQYVGDEVVISWKKNKGIKNNNCLQCFPMIRKLLIEMGVHYKLEYNLQPVFKAGLHFGKVTAGEVGSIKRDIVYSGDVLNTASRIQEQCNHYDVDFIVSGETIDLLSDLQSLKPVHLGNIELRGKAAAVDIYTLASA
jgi:adenylate cyclase